MPDDSVQPVTLSADQVAALRIILTASDPGWYTMHDGMDGEIPPGIDCGIDEWKFLARTFWSDGP